MSALGWVADLFGTALAAYAGYLTARTLDRRAHRCPDCAKTRA